MLAIVALIVAAIVVLAVLAATAHLLFSPWVLVVIGVLAWVKFRPRRSHR